MNCSNFINFLLLFLLIIIMLSWSLLFLMFKYPNYIGIHKCIFNNNKDNLNLIIPNLFLGNISASQDLDFIKKNKIKVIINCSKSIKDSFSDIKDIIYYRIPVNDSLQDEDIELMKDYLPKFVKIIDDNLKNNIPILVHCYAGRQRSAILVAAYLIFKFKYSIPDAYQFILSKRPQAFHYGKSFNFHNSLLDYQQNLLFPK